MTIQSIMQTKVRAILLDFDGPVCSIFAGYPAPQVADEMRLGAESLGAGVPEKLAADREPLDILAWAATIDRPDVLRLVEDTLCDAELSAARSADPTIGARDLLENAQRRGVPIAIVSNNSARAISEYLRLNDLASMVAHVVGRAYGRPDLMKPHPYSVLSALDSLGIAGPDAMLIGDSTTDVTAALAAEVRAVGYANKDGKAYALSEAGADVVVTSMTELADLAL